MFIILMILMISVFHYPHNKHTYYSEMFKATYYNAFNIIEICILHLIFTIVTVNLYSKWCIYEGQHF